MEDDDALEAYNSDSGDDNDFQMEDMSDEDERKGNSDDGESKDGWINWFMTLEGHEYMVYVDLEYINVPFNLNGLMSNLGKEKFKKCIKIILNDKAPTSEELADE